MSHSSSFPPHLFVRVDDIVKARAGRWRRQWSITPIRSPVVILIIVGVVEVVFLLPVFQRGAVSAMETESEDKKKINQKLINSRNENVLLRLVGVAAIMIVVTFHHLIVSGERQKRRMSTTSTQIPVSAHPISSNPPEQHVLANARPPNLLQVASKVLTKVHDDGFHLRLPRRGQNVEHRRLHHVVAIVVPP